MKTTEELKDIYETNPSEWIVIVRDLPTTLARNGTTNASGWRESTFPFSTIMCNYQLIHKKHKDILDSYLANNSVVIIGEGKNSLDEDVEWIEDEFIENYNPDLEYSLREKEWFEVDTHYIMTKENTKGFKPMRKFKIAWTKEMKEGLEATGWRLATKAERRLLACAK